MALILHSGYIGSDAWRRLLEPFVIEQGRLMLQHWCFVTPEGRRDLLPSYVSEAETDLEDLMGVVENDLRASALDADEEHDLQVIKHEHAEGAVDDEL